jgi:hypothetical protein
MKHNRFYNKKFKHNNQSNNQSNKRSLNKSYKPRIQKRKDFFNEIEIGLYSCMLQEIGLLITQMKSKK